LFEESALDDDDDLEPDDDDDELPDGDSLCPEDDEDASLDDAFEFFGFAAATGLLIQFKASAISFARFSSSDIGFSSRASIRGLTSGTGSLGGLLSILLFFSCDFFFGTDELESEAELPALLVLLSSSLEDATVVVVLRDGTTGWLVTIEGLPIQLNASAISFARFSSSDIGLSRRVSFRGLASCTGSLGSLLSTLLFISCDFFFDTDEPESESELPGLLALNFVREGTT
jgi:hypothetical protein